MSKLGPFPAINERYLDRPYVLAGRVIDPLSGTLQWLGKDQHLRRKELEVLALLATEVGNVVSRQAFIAVVWDGNNLVGDHSITSAMSSIRLALQDSDPTNPLIRTIPRKGYQLTQSAQDCPTPALPAYALGKIVTGSAGWRLLQRLSQSDRSETWLAEPSAYDSETDGSNRRVFRFCRSEQHLRRLQREITLLRYVSQSLKERSDVLTIRQWRLDEPPYFLARDYASHGRLADWAEAAGGLAQMPIAERIGLMAAVAAAMAALHGIGVVHQRFDVKRVLMDQEPGANAARPKLSAFALGALMDRSALAAFNITAAGLTLAPEEQLGAAPSTAEDVCALGVLCLQLVLGDLNAQANSETLARVPEPWQALIATCLGPPANRPSAAQVHECLMPPASALSAEQKIDQARVPVTQDSASAARDPLAPSARNSAALPEFIGTYRILDRLGEGGMGTVYLAEQREPVYRKVALKVIRAGLDGKQILARFDAERQALALMSHSNVAAVYETGMAADGRPFFAMEYVAGSDIDRYSDTHKLSLPERITLFLQVCDGVLHAHQKGVLHRDIKPSNLIVSTTAESLGQVKIIDFGLAKSLHGKLASQTLHTSFGAFMGTPVYSSPEQISGMSSSIDTRSDIYSLGVVLYELLAGMPPIASSVLENLEPEKVREIVCNSPLPSMHQHLSSAAEELSARIAQNRKMSAAELPIMLGSDLSWVVGKCLERDPEDRYASVLELKKDLQRWLDLRPVEARPTTAWYRFRKLMRRNRGWVALAASILLVLLGTTAAAIIGYQRADAALKQAELAAAFQVEQIQAIDPQSAGLSLRRELLKSLTARLAERQKLGEPIDIAKPEDLFDGVEFTPLMTGQLNEQVLAPGLKVIGRKYKAYPGLQAALWQSSADSQAKLGLYEPALASQELAITAFIALNGKYHPLTLEAQAKKGSLLAELDRIPEAAAQIDQTLADMRARTGINSEAALEALTARARLFMMDGDYPASWKTYEDIAAGYRQLHGENSVSAYYADVMLAKAMRLKGALPLLEAAVPKLKARAGLNHPYTLDAMTHLAERYEKLRRFDDALTLLQEVERRSAKLYGLAHPNLLPVQQRLAINQVALCQFERALPLFRQIIKRGEDVYGKRAESTVIRRGNYGQALFQSGNLIEAEREVRFAAEVMRESYGLDSTGESNYSAILAAILMRMGRYDEAETLYEARVKLLLDGRGSLSLLTKAKIGLGELYLAKGELDKACQSFQQGVDAMNQTDEIKDDLLPHVTGLQAYCLGLRDGDPAAVQRLQQVIEVQRARHTTNPFDLSSSWVHHARLLNNHERWDEALTSAEAAYQALHAVIPKGHYLMVPALAEKIRALNGMARTSEAAEIQRHAEHLIEKTPGLDRYYRELLPKRSS